MSGVKLSLPLLAAGYLYAMEDQRREAAGVETQARESAAEQERQRRLAEVRDRFILELRDVYVTVQQRDALVPEEANSLREQADSILAALQQAADERTIWNVAKGIPGLQRRLQIALSRQRLAETQQDLQAQRELAEREAGMQRRAEASQIVSELHALVVGLKADPVVMRWHTQAVGELTALAQQAEQEEAPERLAGLLSHTQERAKEIVAEANSAQLRADQRDYIANSIARSLKELGFVVGEPQAEHPGHPATAKILRAANTVGKGISVSVPTEGQVWYDVDGYPKSTEAALGGGTTAVCDEAEQVLLEMHARLDEEFGVTMSEIWWEGKDPNRKLRRAEQLPTVTREVQSSVR